MGQRLTIQIFENKNSEQSIATLYYHWSAYTESALEELKTFYNNYRHYFKIQQIEQKLLQLHPTPFEAVKQYNELDNIVTSIYQAVIETGGGYASNADEAENAINLYSALKTHYNPNHSVNRNNGIVAFTEEQQNELYDWSEGNIRLYLDEEEFEFDVYTSYEVEDDREYYEHRIKEWFNTEDAESITTEQIIDYCANNFPKFDDRQYHKISDIDALITTFEQNTIFYDADEKTIICKIY
jgi:hypothetical protein